MPDDPGSPAERLRPLLRTRQIREFTDEPVDAVLLDAVVDVGRWSGSSQNSQPWRFLVVRDVETIRRIAEAGLPQTRAMRTATAAIAVILPVDPARELVDAYDDGRAAERMLIGAEMLGLGAGICWVRRNVQESISTILGLPADRFVRTILAVGHPSDTARLPKSPPGQARLPRDRTVLYGRWPEDRAVD